MVATMIAKWYVAKLKTYPMITNVSSAMVLMTTGDVLAQELESTNNSIGRQQRQPIQDEVSSILERLVCAATTALTSTSTLGTPASSDKDDDSFSSSNNGFNYDLMRTSKMVLWSVGIYTPFYVGLYRLYDKYLPKQTIGSIFARVCLSFVCSIPVNSAFYVYGSAIDSISIIDNNVNNNNTITDNGDSNNIHTSYHHTTSTSSSLIQFNYPKFYDKSYHKLTNELPNTIVTSGTCWIPINLVSLV